MAAASLPPLLPTNEELVAELECEAFEKLEELVTGPKFLETLEAGAGAVKRASKRRTFLRWGSTREVELQANPTQAPAAPGSNADDAAPAEEVQGAGGAAPDDLTASPFVVVESSGHPDAPDADHEFVVVEKNDAVEAMAFYIAMCIMDLPEAQTMTPQNLQKALAQTMRGMRQSKFRQLCGMGQQVYRWSALTYSALQMYQNPWLMRAVVTALWYSSRTALRLLV